MPRETGNGWKIQKFHDALHAFRDFEEFGLAQNYDCGTNESGLKSWAKDLSATAQMQGAPFIFPAFPSETKDTHSGFLAAKVFGSRSIWNGCTCRIPEFWRYHQKNDADRSLLRSRGFLPSTYSLL